MGGVDTPRAGTLCGHAATTFAQLDNRRPRRGDENRRGACGKPSELHHVGPQGGVRGSVSIRIQRCLRVCPAGDPDQYLHPPVHCCWVPRIRVGGAGLERIDHVLTGAKWRSGGTGHLAGGRECVGHIHFPSGYGSVQCGRRAVDADVGPVHSAGSDNPAFAALVLRSGGRLRRCCQRGYLHRCPRGGELVGGGRDRDGAHTRAAGRSFHARIRVRAGATVRILERWRSDRVGGIRDVANVGEWGRREAQNSSGPALAKPWRTP
jgi:hypothetical protein